MRILLFLWVAFLFLPSTVYAASEPVIAPAPEWVEAVAIPAPNPAQADRPVQTLLVNAQSLYGPERYDHFVEMAVLIQSPQGLQAAGTITIPWQPDQAELIVHKARIIRGSQVIDLLANGQSFTVLRRENNLEMAMLDGVLTAVMQAEGLTVGDVLDVAFTLRRTPGSLGLRGENSLFAMHGFPVRRMSLRQVWTDGVDMRWRGTDLFQAARVRRTARGSELRFEQEDVEGPQPPTQAPARFMIPALLELSGYASWAEIGRAMAPLYARASALAPDSPIRAQIERIAAASTDPRVRALAALRLVQDEVRYLALAMGEGHLNPATAGQTWTRRYGDCKGKTALLLALLRGLGIEAEPVAVNSRMGDMLEQALPQIGAFDHVIVRARIDGTSYWLDGTRTGDRSIEDLAAADFRWGLPLREAGAELEPIPVPVPTEPNLVTEITYDGSQGFAGKVPVRVVTRFRGDYATAMRAALAQVGREAFIQQAREGDYPYRPRNTEVTGVEIGDDDGTGAWTITLIGRAPMQWRRVPGHPVDEFKFDNSTIAWDPDTERPAGPYRDAPFAFELPSYLVTTETIVLPNQGRGYTLQATSFDRTIAGARLSRDVRIAEGRAVSRTSFRRLQPEIPAAELRAAEPPLRAIVDDDAWLRAPEGASVQHAAAAPAQPVSNANAEARDFNERGYQLLQRGDLTGAMAAFTQAAELAPQWATPVANQGIVQIHRRNYAAAEPLLDRAATLDPNDFVVSQGRGLIHLARDEAEPAIAQFTRSIELSPGNRYNLMQRSAALMLAGRVDESLADLDSILAGDPGNVGALTMKARILSSHDRADEALALVDGRLPADPANLGLLRLRAEMLMRSGRTDEARQAFVRTLEQYERLAARGEGGPAVEIRSSLLASAGQVDRAIAVIDEALARSTDNPNFLNARCWLRATMNVELERALADCDRAIGFDPRAAGYIDSRALVRLRLGQNDKAIEDATAALAIEPRLAPSLFVRGVARIRSGDRPGGEADLAAARRIAFDIDAEYQEYGVTP